MRLLSLLTFVLLSLSLSLSAQAQSESSQRVIYLNADHVVMAYEATNEAFTAILTLPSAPQGLSFYVSPDGDYLATFVRFSDTAMRLYVNNLRGDHALLLDQDLLPAEANIILNPIGLGEVAWSPDGASLAFTGAQNGSSDLYLYAPSSNTLSNIFASPLVASQIIWSPDSQYLIFSQIESFPYDPVDYLHQPPPQNIIYYRYEVANGELIPIPLSEDVGNTGFWPVGWPNATTLIYTERIYGLVEAAGLFTLNLLDLTSTERLPNRLPFAKPSFDSMSNTLAFAVPLSFPQSFVPGAYIWPITEPEPSLVQSGQGLFHTVEIVRPGVFQFEGGAGSQLYAPQAQNPALHPLPAHDFGAFISPNPNVDAVVLIRWDSVYVSSLNQDDASLVWEGESQVPIWSPDGTKFYSFGFLGDVAGLIEVDVINRSARLIDETMAINSPRAVAP